MEAESFSVLVADAGEDFLVTCEGEFDISSAPRFLEATEPIIELAPERLHLDCERVTFIDSIGIRAMLHLAARCRSKGIAFTTSINPKMQRLFETIGVSALFSSAP